MNQKVVIIDFDGTLCDFAFPEVGKPKDNVKQALQRLKELGYTIKIHSCRAATRWADRQHYIKDIKDFMVENDLPYDEIIVDVNMDKPIAELYIDDKGLRYRGNWLDTIKQVEEIQNENS